MHENEKIQLFERAPIPRAVQGGGKACRPDDL